MERERERERERENDMKFYASCDGLHANVGRLVASGLSERRFSQGGKFDFGKRTLTRSV